MANWHVAASLNTLLAQLNELAPRRSKVSDGSIGDAAHASRNSDHNPWYRNTVTARDYSHDPAGGLDCNRLAAALVASNDSRIKYVIWNRQIWERGTGWVAYHGINPHDHHLHLSVVASPLCESTTPWFLPGLTGATPQGGDVRLPDLRLGDGEPFTERGIYHWAVDGAQTLLNRRGLKDAAGRPLPPLVVDGVYGVKTVEAVKALQARWKLPVTGAIDAATWPFVVWNAAPDYGPRKTA